MNMTNVWITEEELTSEFLNDLVYPITIKGDNNPRAYGIFPDGCVEEIQVYLKKFLISQDMFPLSLTYIPYEEERYTALFKKLEIEYFLSQIKEAATYHDFYGEHTYHPSCFIVKIKDSATLALLLKETFQLAFENMLYVLTYSKSASFKSGPRNPDSRKSTHSITNFTFDSETTYITPCHDAQGFYLFTNDTKYKNIQSLCTNLPEGSVVTQINDTDLCDLDEE
jgi:hypothetical protein